MTYRIEDFLEIKSAGASGFSPDGSKVLISSNLSGTPQLYRVPRSGGELLQLTDYAEPVAGTYLPASDEIILSRDEGGNERHQIYRCNDDGSDVRPIVYDPDFIHRPSGVTRDGRQLCMTSNRRNGVDFDVYVVDLETGDPRVPLGEAEQIHAALKAKGVRTELLVYPDEGHGLAKLKNRLDAYPRAVAFLDEVLLP